MGSTPVEGSAFVCRVVLHVPNLHSRQWRRLIAGPVLSDASGEAQADKIPRLWKRFVGRDLPD